MNEQTIIPISDMPDSGGFFGNNQVTLKQLAGGPDHKEARQVGHKLSDILARLDVQHKMGTEYLDHKNYAPFVDVQIGNNNYFFIGTRSAGDDIDPESHTIKIVGGTCIGGKETISGFDKAGNVHSLLESEVPDTLDEQINSLVLNPKPTLYEVDIIERTTKFIKALMNGGMSPKHDVSLYWHVPYPEYLLYLKQYYDSGVLTDVQCKELATFLKKKTSVLEDWFSNKLKKQINPIQFGSPLENIITPVNLFEKHLDLEDTLEMLKQDKLWNSIINTTMISSWTQLADASYSYMYLQQSDGQTTIGIEDPGEGKILSVAKKMAQKSGIPFNMTCLYPHPGVLEGVSKPARLYRHQKTIPDEVLLVHRQY